MAMASASRSRRTSSGLLHVEAGSLYPALQCLQGWVSAEWEKGQSHQRAKVHRVPLWQKATGLRLERWGSMVASVGHHERQQEWGMNPFRSLSNALRRKD